MNRASRRALLAEQHRFVEKLPVNLTILPRDEWPSIQPLPVEVWCSRKYFVQLYEAKDGVRRLTVSRSKQGSDGRWQDNITWDELQEIKALVGFGDCYAVEIYPRDRDLVNDANMRHLWLLPEPLNIGWFS